MVHIPNNARVLIAGKTGSGKSYLTEVYLSGYDYVIKLDTKGEALERRSEKLPLWRGLQEGRDYSVIEHFEDIESVNTHKIIYCPEYAEQTIEYYNTFFDYVYRRENTIVWIDELMSICDSPLKYPLMLKACYTRGRSKNIGIWALTQRPVDIPAICASNSEIFIAFDLMLNQDREKMSKITGVEAFRSRPGSRKHPYAFYYYDLRWEEAILAEIKE